MNNSPGWLRWTARLLMATTVVGIGLIMAGLFDPRPVGDMRWTKSLMAVRIQSRTRQIVPQDLALPDQNFTLRLTVNHLSGELDVGYGLVLGSSANYFAVAISPVGYVTIWQESNGDSGQVGRALKRVLPWQTWPHINAVSEPNEIGLDVRDDYVVVRINHEHLWEGEVSGLTRMVSLYGESFGEEACINFQSLTLFTSRDD